MLDPREIILARYLPLYLDEKQSEVKQVEVTGL